MQCHYISIFSIFAIVLLSFDARAEIQQSHSGKFDDRFGYHLFDPHSISSNLQMVSLDKKIQFNSWSGVFAARAWHEASYINDGQEYPNSLRQADSEELTLRDFYLQYKVENTFIRIGNQQVVWGEAFGFFYSDIINPKDLRDGGFRELEDIRIPVPIINLKYSLDRFSIQAIYLPKAYFNMNPLPGSDFSARIKELNFANTLSVNRNLSAAIEPANGEYGGRLSLNTQGIDTSWFFFSYLDRTPHYTINSSSSLPNSISLDEHHSRIFSTGATLSYEKSGFVYRLEALKTFNRKYTNIIFSQAGVPSLNNPFSDESIFVLGLDLPQVEKFNFGFQYSESSISDYFENSLRPQVQQLFSLRASSAFSDNHTGQVIYANQTNDGSSALQLEYLYSGFDKIEFKLGADFFEGASSSHFGSIHHASRIYTHIRLWFSDSTSQKSESSNL